MGPLHESIKLLSPLTNLEELCLSDNKLGGTITSDVAVFTKLKKLKLHSMELDGKIGSTRSERFTFRVDMVTFFAGQLPKELGKLVNLKELDVYGNKIEGQLSVRAELHDRRASNLTLLHRRYPCRAGAVGKVDAPRCVGQYVDRCALSTRTERLRVLLIFTFSAGELPKQLGQLTKLTHLDVSENELTGALSTPFSLEVFNVGDSFGNTNKFTGGIPPE